MNAPTRVHDSIVYFSSIDWGHTWQRPQQLASRLAQRSGPLLYVNPLALRPPRAHDLWRLLARMTSRRQPAPRVDLLRALLTWPAPTLTAAIRWNARRLGRSVQRWLRLKGCARPALWVGVPNPAVLRTIDTLPFQSVIYDCLDPFPAFHPESDAIPRTEAQIARRAHVVFATSVALLDAMRALNPRAQLLPNAADVARFAPAASAHPVPRDLAALDRPWLGYVGELAEWLDVDALHALASDRGSVILIGPGRGATLRTLSRHPKIHWLGPRPYRDLPVYLSHFDVCLLPFRVSPFTDAINPVKLYEYLASGRPVVSAPIAEARRFRDVVTLVEGHSWPEAVSRALGSANDDAARARRLAVARANDWDERIETILRSLHDQ